MSTPIPIKAINNVLLILPITNNRFFRDKRLNFIDRTCLCHGRNSSEHSPKKEATI